MGEVGDVVVPRAGARALPRSATSSAAVRYGLSTPKLREAEYDASGGNDAFGTWEDIANDIIRLGLGAVRHPGRLQLTMDDIAAFGAGIPVDTTDLHDGIVRDQKFRWIDDLVQHLDSAGHRCTLFITFLTLGGGTTPVGTSDAMPSRLSWSEDHRGRTVVADDGTAAAFDDSTDTLAPANAYKRRYVTLMAEAVGDGLANLRTALSRSGIAIEEYIEAIEIGNEVDIRDLIDDGTDYVADAVSWAQLIYYAGTALKTRCPWLALRFPGLASTARTGTGADGVIQDWATKVAFVRATLRELDGTFGAGTAATLLSGVDLHYYHQRGAAEPDPDTQRLSYLFADVDEMRRLFQLYGVASPQISVFEDGVTSWCTGSGPTSLVAAGYPSGCEADDAGYAAYDHARTGLLTDRPAVSYCGGRTFGRSIGTVGANAFQAMSVWMRLGAAAAAGASTSGWHTLMGGESRGFLGTGLRRDLHDSGLDPNLAEERASSHAVSRMVRYLGRATSVTRLTVGGIYTTPSHDDIDNLLTAGTWSPEDDVFVIEFLSPFPASDRPESGLPYVAAYLVFVDPAGSAACAVVTLRAGGTSPQSTFLVEVLTEPESVSVRTHAAGSLPQSEWVDAASRLVFPAGDGTVELTVGRGEWPNLLCSDRRLTFDAVSVR